MLSTHREQRIGHDFRIHGAYCIRCWMCMCVKSDVSLVRAADNSVALAIKPGKTVSWKRTMEIPNESSQCNSDTAAFRTGSLSFLCFFVTTAQVHNLISYSHPNTRAHLSCFFKGGLTLAVIRAVVRHCGLDRQLWVWLVAGGQLKPCASVAVAMAPLPWPWRLLACCR